MGRGNQASGSRSNPKKSPKRTVLRQNKTTGDFYVKIFLGAHTTWHFTSDGLHHLARRKIRVGDELPHGMFGYLRDKQWIFTGGSGAEPAEADDRYTPPREARGNRPQPTSLPARSTQAKQPKGREPIVKQGQPRTDRPSSSTVFLRPLRNDPTQERARSVADDPIVRRPDRTRVQPNRASPPSESTPSRPGSGTPPRKRQEEVASLPKKQPNRGTSTPRQKELTLAPTTNAEAANESASARPRPFLQGAGVDQGPSSRPLEMDQSPALNECHEIEPTTNDRSRGALPPFEAGQPAPRDQAAPVPPSYGWRSDASDGTDAGEAHQVLAKWLSETLPSVSAVSSPESSRPPRLGFLPLLLIICLVLLALLAFSGIHTR